jgi:hypothetical protein
VYNPEAVTVPDVVDHFTAVFVVPVTVAVNCCDAPEYTAAVAGEIVTATRTGLPANAGIVHNASPRSETIRFMVPSNPARICLSLSAATFHQLAHTAHRANVHRTAAISMVVTTSIASALPIRGSLAIRWIKPEMLPKLTYNICFTYFSALQALQGDASPFQTRFPPRQSGAVASLPTCLKAIAVPCRNDRLFESQVDSGV